MTNERIIELLIDKGYIIFFGGDANSHTSITTGENPNKDNKEYYWDQATF